MPKKSNYDGPYEQKSIQDEGHSVLPLKSDGSLRESSNAVAPIKKDRAKPVNQTK